MEKPAVYHLAYQNRKRNTAGAKAPDDVTSICNRMGFQEIRMPMLPHGKSNLYKRIWLSTVGTCSWMKAYRAIPADSILVYQHPAYGIRMILRYVRKLKKKKNCRTIALIHDLESLRGGIKGVLKDDKKKNEISDQTRLKEFNAVICHNEHMRQYLIGAGFRADRVINLELFDYLTDAEMRRETGDDHLSVAIAGNLLAGKSAYIYRINEKNTNSGLKINLYGNNYDEARGTSLMSYKGSFRPEEIPGVLEGAFGLVWDGTEAATCAGNTGEYLKYNNPHKTSLYLVAGMPVIVWDQAAVADFVLGNKAGIAVGSLYEIEDAIRAVTKEAYAAMCENAARISERLRDGYYCKKALREAVDRIISGELA